MNADVLRRLYRGQTNIDFIGRRKLWFAISAVLLAICIGTLATKGLNYGIEFKGGVSIRAPISDELAGLSDADVVSRVSDSLQPFGASDAQIQVVTDEDGPRNILVQTKEVADPEAQERVVGAVSRAVGATIAETASDRVGSKWGGEITRKAVRALAAFVLVVLVFISLRFEWKMAIAAIAALAHDLLITSGVYALVGFEVTPSTVIAILTILGYSLYDTVVVFDKVEENTSTLAATGRMTYQDSANLAMNQVFMRSLNTSLTTLLPVGALLFGGAGLLGAETLKDLALALLVGILVSTYSSIFVATPILSIMKEREPRYRNIREKVLREARRGGGAAPAVTPAPVAAGEPAAITTSPTRSRPATSTRPRTGTKKAKRRRRR